MSDRACCWGIDGCDCWKVGCGECHDCHCLKAECPECAETVATLARLEASL